VDSRIFERGYALLFRVGRWYRYFLLPAASAALVAMVTHLSLPPHYLAVAIASPPLSFLLILLTTRRSLRIRAKGFGLTISSIYTFQSSMVDTILSMIAQRFMMGFGVATVIPQLAYTLMVLRGIDHRDGDRMGYFVYPLAAMPVAIPVQLLASAVTGFTNVFRYVVVDAGMYTSSSLSMIFLISRFGSNEAISILRLFSSYLYAAFLSYGEPFETELSRLSIVGNGKVHVIHMGNGLAVVSEFHGGPMAGVGGGKLTQELVKALSRHAKPVVYLHGVGSHERDPVSSRDVERIVSEVTKAVERIPAVTQRCIGRPPLQLWSSRFRITHIPICSKSLIFISRLAKSSDDIPTWVYDRLKSMIDAEWDNLILIDAQNNFSPNNTWDEDEIEELSELIRRILRKEPRELSIRSSMINIPRDVFGDLQVEIGDNGLSLWLMEINGVSVLLVIFDGNNIVGELTNKIISSLAGLFNVVEVASTDNHQFTGLANLSLGKGYHAVGEAVDHEHVLSIIKAEVNKGLSLMETTYPRYVEVVVNNVKILGRDGFMKLEEAARMGVRDWWRYLVMLLIVPVAFTMILSLI